MQFKKDNTEPKFVDIVLDWLNQPCVNTLGLPTLRVIHKNCPVENLDGWIKHYKLIYNT